MTNSFTPSPAHVPNIWKWLQRAAVDWTIIAVCFWAAHWSIFESPNLLIGFLTLVPLMVIIGARQHALGILGHDGAHRLICRNRALNDVLTNFLVYWPLTTSLSGHRAFHFAHHRKVGTDEDPERIHTRDNTWRILNIPILGQWPVPIRPWKFVVFILGDFLGGAIPHIIMAKHLTRPRKGRDVVEQLLYLAAVFAVCLYFQAWWIPLLWFVTLGTVFWSIFRVRIWTEHIGTDGTHVLNPTPLQKFFLVPHNTWCHYEHHEHPNVPCWALHQFAIHRCRR